MRGKAEHMGDEELYLVESHLEDMLVREDGRTAGWEEDPMTEHYGIAGEVAQLVYARYNRIEAALNEVDFELRFRGLRAWDGTESMNDVKRRRFEHLNPMPQEYNEFSEHFGMTGEMPEGWTPERLYHMFVDYLVRADYELGPKPDLLEEL